MESSLVRLSNLSRVGEDSGVVKAERLEMREADKRLVTLDGRNEREGELDQLGELDALDIEIGRVDLRSRANERDTRAWQTEAHRERRLRREEVAARQGSQLTL